MAFSEECFELKNDAGHSMYGIIHHPISANGSLVMLFNIGLHYRTSHSLMFVRLARSLAESGFTVVRSDPSRIGYSQGELFAERAIDLYDAVQTGLFREDAESTLKYLRARFAPRKTFFAGLCGGALTATITAAADGGVDGVVFIAGPVTVTSPEAEMSTMHLFEADQLLSMYLGRALNPKAWWRFVSGRSDYGDLFRSIKLRLHDWLSRIKPTGHTEEASDVTDEESGEQKGERINRVFTAALDRLLKNGRSVQFVMPELDRATYDFDRLFVRSFENRYKDHRSLYEIARIPRANHTFSTPESSRQLFATVAGWLGEQSRS
jgi:hypothetical protein